MPKDLNYYMNQLRRIEEHREAGAERAIRKTYKEILRDTQHWLSDEYIRLSENGELTYAMLQSRGEYARFLEEVETRLNGITPKVSQEIRETVEEIYRISYTGMTDAVLKAQNSNELRTALEGISGVSEDVVKAAIENPIAGLTLNDTLERNRRNIIYSIKQQIGIGLTQGDRQTTMAKRIAKVLDDDYKKAVRIVRTETHRVIESGHADSAREINRELENAGVDDRLVKIWRNMADARVRDTHAPMEGQTVAADEKFKLPSGAKADAPGNSGVASEDINCRCFVEYELRPIKKTK